MGPAYATAIAGILAGALARSVAAGRISSNEPAGCIVAAIAEHAAAAFAFLVACQNIIAAGGGVAAFAAPATVAFARSVSRGTASMGA